MHLKNSLSQSLVPINANPVEIYLCGHTAYKPPHLGNMRPVVVFDLLIRVLRHLGQDVIYVRNTTDIDDKIIHRAQEEGVEMEVITDRAIEAHSEAEHILGCKPPNLNPMATGYIQEIIRLVDGMIASGKAYATEEGDVFFDTSNLESPDFYPTDFKDSDNQAGGKLNPRDFALWKSAKPGEPSWASPYGLGRPGWHTECVAMILATTQQLVIHGGGCDLKFPHHANELLQLREYGHVPNVWVHTGMVVDQSGHKMSKSADNTLDFVSLGDEIPGVILRIALLMTHYRQPLPWGRERLEQAASIWGKIHARLRNAKYKLSDTTPPASVLDILCNDLNTPEVFATLFQLKDDEFFATVDLLGLMDAYHTPSKTSGKEIEEYIQQYLEAKKAKDYEKSDKIRDALLHDGIHIEKDGKWWCGIGSDTKSDN